MQKQRAETAKQQPWQLPAQTTRQTSAAPTGPTRQASAADARSNVPLYKSGPKRARHQQCQDNLLTPNSPAQPPNRSQNGRLQYVQQNFKTKKQTLNAAIF